MLRLHENELSGLKFRQVDVFSEHPLSGNGLAVFWNSGELSPETMQRLTREMRQFESIFLKQIEGRHTFRARIFAMEEELDFAGHPILGAAAVLHEQYEDNDTAYWSLVLNTRRIEVGSQKTTNGFRITMNQGRPEFYPPLGQERALPFLQALNLTLEDQAPGYPLGVVSTGLPYLVVPVSGGLERARILTTDFENLLASVKAKFVYVLDVENREGRTWDNKGRVEDIATGSAAGTGGAYLYKHDAVGSGETIVLHQGRFVGRPSRIEVRVEGRRGDVHGVHVSGNVCMVACGIYD